MWAQRHVVRTRVSRTKKKVRGSTWKKCVSLGCSFPSACCRVTLLQLGTFDMHKVSVAIKRPSACFVWWKRQSWVCSVRACLRCVQKWAWSLWSAWKGFCRGQNRTGSWCCGLWWWIPMSSLFLCVLDTFYNHTRLSPAAERGHGGTGGLEKACGN